MVDVMATKTATMKEQMRLTTDSTITVADGDSVTVSNGVGAWGLLGTGGRGGQKM